MQRELAELANRSSFPMSFARSIVLAACRSRGKRKKSRDLRKRSLHTALELRIKHNSVALRTNGRDRATFETRENDGDGTKVVWREEEEEVIAGLIHACNDITDLREIIYAISQSRLRKTRRGTGIAGTGLEPIIAAS